MEWTVGTKVYHKASGAPMIILNAEGGEKFDCRYFDNSGIANSNIFLKEELVDISELPAAQYYEKFQELSNEANMIQAELAVKNLKAQKNGITQPNLKTPNGKLARPRF